MTIDETIDYYKVDAKENKHLWKVYENYDKDLALMHKEYGERSERTSEWLKELKAYRKAHETIRELPQVWEEGAGIKKCLDILKERLEHEGTDQTGD